jgi:Holliday junction resolvase RusA-like endonuclease
MSQRIEFTVLGTPRPQGSMKAFVIDGQARLTSDNAKMKPWRQQVGQTALAERAGIGCFEVWAGRHIAVGIRMDYYFARPKSARKRILHVVKPDRDKLDRAIGDALKGILYADDGQIVEGSSQKHYGLPERAVITVWKVE